MLNSFFITERVEIFYKFQLSKFMKIYDLFHSYLLQKDLNDFLLEQIQKFSSFIIRKKSKKYALDNIENSR